MEQAHELILLGGALGLASIFAGLLSARLGAPLLLVFLAVGMLAGEDGPGGIPFGDFAGSYLVGSIALAVILFDGGLSTERPMWRAAFWPALALATLGVGITAGIVAGVGVFGFGVPWQQAAIIGAVLAPTDAAAVGLLLRRARVDVPERLIAVLEIESGLNDPMSVLLTLVFVTALTGSGGLSPAHLATEFAREMGGGAAAGLAGGYGLLWLLRRVPAEAAIIPVLALAAVLTLFGAVQWLGASGFLAVYLAGAIAGTHAFDLRGRMEEFFQALGWLAQITLFLLLGLLVTPHALAPQAASIAAVTAVLILLARPVASLVCLLPFGFGLRATGFAAWVGLRGAVPIYLTIIPVLQHAPGGTAIFGIAFGTVVASLVVQGWTIAPAARLLGFGPAEE